MSMRQVAKVTIRFIITIIDLKKNYLQYYFNHRSCQYFSSFKDSLRNARVREQDIPLRQGPDIPLHIRTTRRQTCVRIADWIEMRQ